MDDHGRSVQLAIWRRMGPERRLQLASELIAFARRMRDARLRERFPAATDEELGWARAREALRLPPALSRP